MELQWTIYVTRSGNAEPVALATFCRPTVGAVLSDFGLSIAEARQLVSALQRAVAQDQICAYDARRRCCRHCGKYRRIKDWRPRTLATGLGEIDVRVPRVISCLCTPEPLDDDDDPTDLRFSECPIERQLPGRRTPEVAYLCAKHGALVPYRCAAQTVADITGLRRLSHATVRKETIKCGEHIEDKQFREGWFAGGAKADGARHLRIAIDGTVLTAVPWEEVSKFEVIAGRVERDGRMGRRFVCALPRRTLTQMLVAAALEQCGWVKETLVDVVTDGARGMRSLVISIVPRVAPKILDWFHLSIKLRAVQTPLCARTYFMEDRPMFMARCERLWRATRDALWRGKADFAIELTRTLVASLKEEAAVLPPFFAGCASTACGAAGALMTFLTNNRRDLIDHQRARMDGGRISSASAESVMNHLVNRRLSKLQQMRWSMKGAHCLLQTRAELLDGRLEQCFTTRFAGFRSPELRELIGVLPHFLSAPRNCEPQYWLRHRRSAPEPVGSYSIASMCAVPIL